MAACIIPAASIGEWVASGDVKGGPLKPDAVKKAREAEMAYVYNMRFTACPEERVLGKDGQATTPHGLL